MVKWELHFPPSPIHHFTNSPIHHFTMRARMTMHQSQWSGVFPAITTPFHDDGSVDHDALAAHVRSLGEAATLTFDEKVRVNETCVRAIDGRVPVVAGIAGLATSECVALARA